LYSAFCYQKFETYKSQLVGRVARFYLNIRKEVLNKNRQAKQSNEFIYILAGDRVFATLKLCEFPPLLWKLQYCDPKLAP